MTCREFRARHLDYSDRTLSTARHAAAQAHLDACAACARFDTIVRRGLLLVHNLPPVPSTPDFHPRLTARLARARSAAPTLERARRPRPLAIVAAASLAFAAGLLIAVGPRGRQMTSLPALTLAPVVAVASRPPERSPERLPMMRPDVMAGASAGIPLWSAAALIDEAPVRFVSAQMSPFSPRR